MDKNHSVIGILIGFLLVFLSNIGCTTYNLERSLLGDIHEWYSLHSPLMSGKVPLWIDANDRSEREHFLRLPAHIQKVYIQSFWRIRQEGLGDIFYSRIEYTIRAFENASNPWRSDRGRVFLLLGPPTLVRYYRDGQESLSSMPQSGDLLQWYYYHSRAGRATYWFEFIPPDTWRDKVDMELRVIGDKNRYENYWRGVFSPTEEGWAEWASVLYDELNAVKKHKKKQE